MESDDIAAPTTALDEPAPGDPLHVVHSITDATASETPFSTRPGDWVYEADDVSFNLSAAHRCLEATRRTVAALREGNRHRRGSGTEASRSRSRQRSPGPDSDTADRRGEAQQLIPAVPSNLPHKPSGAYPSGELLDPLPLTPGNMTRDLRTPCTLPEWKNLLAHDVIAQVVSGALACSAIHLPSLQLACTPLWHHRPHRYCCAAVFPLQKAWTVLTAWSFLCARLTSLVCIYLLRSCLGEGTCAPRASTSDNHMPAHTRPSSRVDTRDPGLQATTQALPKPITNSRLGPNSQGLTVLHLFFLLLCVIIQPACAGGGAEARVVVPAAGTAEGAYSPQPISFAPKLGSLPTTSSPTPRTALKRCVKRSFRRACMRAMTQGSTTYRGRAFKAQEVPDSLRQSFVYSRPPPSTRQNPAHGLRIFCWNAGGLGGGLYPELLTFLDNSQYDVAVILESKWQECMEYTTGQWSCIHSGCKTRKQAGVLILVHHRIAPPSQLRFEHILQGRILHVRVPLPGKDSRHIHLVGVYQKAYDQKPASLEQRQQVWQAIDRCMARLPVRDSLALLGDFNTPLKTSKPHVGDHTHPLPCHPPEDVDDFMALLTTYDLVALNTWSRPLDKKLPSTFRFQATESQIDFILTRRPDATHQARRARAWRSFHVGASRHGGAIHFPLQALLTLRCPHWVRQPTQVRPNIDREALLQVLDQPTASQHLGKIAAIRQAVANHMASFPGLQGVSTLHHSLFRACADIFPAKAATKPPHTWQAVEVQNGIKNMWQQWRAFKKIRKNGLQGWFAAWKAWRSFDRHYREHQLRCRQARRSKLLNAMEEAQQCASRHDSRGLYQIVKRIAPKQSFRRMQLRDPQSMLKCRTRRHLMPSV